MPPIPPENALRDLAGKYAEMIALRRARDAGAPHPPAAVLRSLSRRFPGCLRELDRCRLADLQDRLAGVEAARRPPHTIAEWIPWVLDYHRLLAGTLAAPRTAHAPAERSAGGRPSAAILTEVARLHGVDRATLAAHLFPPRR